MESGMKKKREEKRYINYKQDIDDKEGYQINQSVMQCNGVVG